MSDLSQSDCPEGEERCVYCGECKGPDAFEDGLRCKTCAEEQDDLSGCPDGGTCHHGCTDSCWRVSTCEPLSASGWTDWPEEIKAANPPVARFENALLAPEHTTVKVLTTVPLAVLDSFPPEARQVIQCPHCSQPITLGIEAPPCPGGTDHMLR